MKSLEKLREWAQKFGPMGSHDPLMLADEIEAEVAERYMELPKDADGVPIRVGDAVAEKPFRPNAGEKPAEVVCMLLNSDGWAIGDCDPRGHWYNPSALKHVKLDPLKELLHEMLDRNSDGVGYREFNYDFEAFVDAYADRIRELMEVDDAS